MFRNHKFLIAFIGPVGSGKTHLAKILARSLDAAHVRTDDIRVTLRRGGKSYSSARSMANKLAEKLLGRGKSVVNDFDAVLPARQRELKKRAQKFGAKLVLIKIKTPEKLIIRRLKRHKYTKADLFRNAAEAIRVYYIRRNLHLRKFRTRPDLVINNARPLAPQIKKIVKILRGPMV